MEIAIEYIVGGISALIGLIVVVLAARGRSLPAPEKSEELPENEAAAQLEAVSDGQATEDKIKELQAARAAEELAEAEAAKAGLFGRLKAGLSKTQKQLIERLDDVLQGRKEIDEALFEELEMILITSDMGVRTVTKLLDELRDQLSRDELADGAAIRAHLQLRISEILGRHDSTLSTTMANPYVIMIVGVNGVGKTTTIGKLATRFTREGKSVILAAGDTFRAAAIEQLEVWGDRAGVPVIKREAGSDPSSVIYDALEYAKANNIDVVIADTAGRLHTKINLMEELHKIHRVIGKCIPGAPHESLLVLDATTGQNAVVQAKAFHEGAPLTGLVLTKLDGTAKGGVIISVSDEMSLPVKFIGVGEQVDDLRPFDAQDFVQALFD